MFRWAIFAGFVIMASLAFGVYLGTIESVALCYAASMCVLAYPQFAIPGKLIGLCSGPRRSGPFPDRSFALSL